MTITTAPNRPKLEYAQATRRKPLGVRVTPEQHQLLIEAAHREHRSVSSFVLQAALRAAEAVPTRVRTPETVQQAIDRVQAIMHKLVPPGRSLVDEVIAEHRAEAVRE